MRRNAKAVPISRHLGLELVIVHISFYSLSDIDRWVFNSPSKCNTILIALSGLSIILMVMVSHPDESLWSTFAVSLFTPFWAISISLNVILTGLITARLLWLKSRIRKILGVAHSNMYTSISALLIESAGLYTIFALMYVVMYALRNKAQNIVIPILTLMTVGILSHSLLKRRQNCLSNLFTSFVVNRPHAYYLSRCKRSSVDFTNYPSQHRNDVRSHFSSIRRTVESLCTDCHRRQASQHTADFALALGN